MEKSWKDTEAKKRWDKENTIRYSLKLNKNTDREIISQIERMKGKTDPATGEPWTLQSALKAMLASNPELLTLIQEARKLSPEQLQTVIEIVERINAGEDIAEILIVE